MPPFLRPGHDGPLDQRVRTLPGLAPRVSSPSGVREDDVPTPGSVTIALSPSVRARSTPGTATVSIRGRPKRPILHTRHMAGICTDSILYSVFRNKLTRLSP